MPRRKTENSGSKPSLNKGAEISDIKPKRTAKRPAGGIKKPGPVKIGVKVYKTEPIEASLAARTAWPEPEETPRSDALPEAGFERLEQPAPRPEIGRMAARAVADAGRSLTGGLGATGRIRIEPAPAAKRRLLWLAVTAVMLSILVIWTLNIRAIVNPPVIFDLGPRKAADTPDPKDDLVKSLTEIKAGMSVIREELERAKTASTTTPPIDDQVLLELKDMIESGTATATASGTDGRLPQ